MSFDLTQARGLLERTPPALEALLRGLPQEWAIANEGPDTWSPFDIVGHLIHGEKTDWIPRARIILEHGPARAFEPFDRFAQLELSKGHTLEQQLDTFLALRQQNLRDLDGLNLSPTDLERHGTHPELGIVTLAQLVRTWSLHDLSHIAQISRVLVRHLAPGIGPWREYLPIVSR